MRCKEKLFKKFKFRRNKQTVWNNLKNARHLFNKQFKSHRRHYERTKIIEIESFNTKNHSEISNKIKSLGPRHKKSIPMAVLDEMVLLIQTASLSCQNGKKILNLYICNLI